MSEYLSPEDFARAAKRGMSVAKLQARIKTREAAEWTLVEAEAVIREYLPNVAADELARWLSTWERNALIFKLWPEGINDSHDTEKVVARIQKHFPHIRDVEIVHKRPDRLVYYLHEVLRLESKQLNGDRTQPDKSDTDKKNSSPKSDINVKLIQRLKRLGNHESMTDVCREFAEKHHKNEDSLIRTANRYKHLWDAGQKPDTHF